jgi:hypothetical protein
MPTRLTIKIDNCKLRIYLEGETHLVSTYLASKHYVDARKELANKRNFISRAQVYRDILSLKAQTLMEEQAHRNNLNQNAQQLRKQTLASDAVQLPENIQQEQDETSDLQFLFVEYDKVSLQASKRVEAYSVPPYHFIYDDYNGNNEKFLMVQFSFIVGEHFTDETLLEEIKGLIESLNPINEVALSPIHSLIARKYHPVFCQTIEQALALQVVQNFEDLAQRIAKTQDPNFTSLISRVEICYDPLAVATHLSTSGVFASSRFGTTQMQPALSSLANNR